MKIVNKNTMLAILLGSMIWGCATEEEQPSVKEELFRLPENAYVLAEQSRNSIVIRDSETQQNIWSWDPYSGNVPYENQGWFVNPSEVKPVFNRRYVLMTASGGAVALIRLSDHKLMFYAYCGQNPHSAEILPDGNIVTAESRSGEINTFVVDTLSVLGTKSATIKIGNAHNVVWDRKRMCLYATGTLNSGVTALFRFKYNNDRTHPKLIDQTRIYSFDKESGGHDLFPVYGEDDKLWFSAASAVYKFDVSGNEVSCDKIYDIPEVKSICNGPKGILLLKPAVEWWSEGLVNEYGQMIFTMAGSKIYKGRWMIDNTFSYPEEHNFILGTDE